MEKRTRPHRSGGADDPGVVCVACLLAEGRASVPLRANRRGLRGELPVRVRGVVDGQRAVAVLRRARDDDLAQGGVARAGVVAFDVARRTRDDADGVRAARVRVVVAAAGRRHARCVGDAGGHRVGEVALVVVPVAGEVHVDMRRFEQRHDRSLRRRVHPPELVALRDEPGRARAVHGGEVRLHPVHHVFDAAVNVRLAVEGEHVHALRRARVDLERVEERSASVGELVYAAVPDFVLGEVVGALSCMGRGGGLERDATQFTLAKRSYYLLADKAHLVVARRWRHREARSVRMRAVHEKIAVCARFRLEVVCPVACQQKEDKRRRRRL